MTLVSGAIPGKAIGLVFGGEDKEVGGLSGYEKIVILPYRSCRVGEEWVCGHHGHHWKAEVDPRGREAQEWVYMGGVVDVVMVEGRAGPPDTAVPASGHAFAAAAPVRPPHTAERGGYQESWRQGLLFICWALLGVVKQKHGRTCVRSEDRGV